MICVDNRSSRRLRLRPPLAFPIRRSVPLRRGTSSVNFVGDPEPWPALSYVRVRPLATRNRSTGCRKRLGAVSAMHYQAASDDRFGVVHVEVVAAVRAHDAGGDALAAGLVEEVDRRSREAGPAIAPRHQRGVDGEQLATLVCEAVFVQLAGRVLGVRAAFEDSVLHECVEFVGENVARQADATLEILEAPGAVERLAQDHPHPALADDA